MTVNCNLTVQTFNIFSYSLANLIWLSKLELFTKLKWRISPELPKLQHESSAVIIRTQLGMNGSDFDIMSSVLQFSKGFQNPTTSTHKLKRAWLKL